MIGGEIVSTFGKPELVKMDRCDLVEQVIWCSSCSCFKCYFCYSGSYLYSNLVLQVSIGDETLLKFSGIPFGEACSIVLRGATEQVWIFWSLWITFIASSILIFVTQIIGEAERSLHNALCVLTSTVKEPRSLKGGGCSEMVGTNGFAVDSRILV